MGRLVIMVTIIFDLVTFAGIFVAIGHDNNASIECTSTNNLCPGTARVDAGFDIETMTAGTSVSGPWTVSFNGLGFPVAPNVTLTVAYLAPPPPVAGVFSGTGTFLASEPAATWTAMPAATTEIFGNTNHRLNVTFPAGSALNAKAALGVNCVTASNTANARLNLQRSTNGGSTWLTVGSSIIIDNTKCPGLQTVALVNIGVNAVTNTDLFRVVGTGGGAGGDNPAFSLVYVQFQQNVQSLCTASLTLPLPGVSTFTYEIVCSSPVVSATTFTTEWHAR